MAAIGVLNPDGKYVVEVPYEQLQHTIRRRVVGFLVSAAQAPPTKTPHSIFRYAVVDPVVRSALPTSPGAAGTLWNDGGIVRVAT
jgi:hypothetical protein